MYPKSLLVMVLLLVVGGVHAQSVFRFPDANPPNGLYRPDIQNSYPQVDWQTLDILCLPPGQFAFMRLGNLPDRSADTPLTITNCDGQTRIGGLGHYYMFLLGGGSHWRLTGRYDPEEGTGHPDFRGHDAGYANSQGQYGILIDDESIEEGGPSGLGIGSGATDFEIDYIEVRRVGFAGMILKTDNAGDATMANVRIHDNYIHDIGSEGLYIGSTQAHPQHSVTGLKFYNNRVLRTGTEIFQLGQIGPDTEVYNNVFLAGALDWKNPFQRFQDNSVQLGPRYGGFSFRNNVVIGAGEKWMNFIGRDLDDDPHPGSSLVEITDNYFSSSRFFGAYVARLTQPGMSVLFARNQFRDLRFQYDEVYNNTDYDQFFRMGAGGTANSIPIAFEDNQFDGNQHFINNWDDPNRSEGNISASGNQRMSLPAVVFEDSGFADDFDWLRLEIWTDVDRNGDPVSYLQGDVVSVDGDLFECLPAAGCAAGRHPTDAGNASLWLARAWPADDVRLSVVSPARGVGLLDDAGRIFADRFQLGPITR